MSALFCSIHNVGVGTLPECVRACQAAPEWLNAGLAAQQRAMQSPPKLETHVVHAEELQVCNGACCLPQLPVAVAKPLT